MFKAGTAVEMKDLQPGDVVFYSMETEGNAEYAGIYVGDGQFVAANNPDSPSSLQTMSWKYFTDRFGRRAPVLRQSGKGISSRFSAC